MGAKITERTTMRSIILLLVVIMMSAAVSGFEPNDTEPTWGSEDLLLETFDSIRDFDDIAVGDVTGKDMPAVLARLKEMPNLQTLKFHSCDLSKVSLMGKRSTCHLISENITIPKNTITITSN
jgi:hypothetical protein